VRGPRRSGARHVVTLLGNKPTPKAVEALVAGLERDGIVKTGDKKIEYTIPKKGTIG